MATDVTLKDLLEELAEQRNFDFRGYKNSTLERRFRRRMFQLSLGGYDEYSRYIHQHPDETNELLNTLLINVTEFFRDPPAWEILRHEVLPSLLKRIQPGHSFRVWSAGCASGEEAYSIAILLTEHLGPRIQDYDIKIYATDIDDDALNTARRGEYSIDSLRAMRPEWREKYFNGKGLLRVNREVRRLVIFGRSNLAHDAPISHVNLLVCRNLLIYFDSELQKQILARLHYALDPGGVLFLGKSESQLTNSPTFQRLNARWRIFQRITATDDRIQVRQENSGPMPEEADRKRQELESFRQQQRYFMETLRAGVLSLDVDDMIVLNNAAALILCGLQPVNLAGKRVTDTDIFIRIQELASHLQATRLNNESSRFQCHVTIGAEDKLLEITVRPVLDEKGQRSGTLVYIDDQTVQEKLQSTVEELESTSEELQSANEELETTNEELQSTNEELETTNEELQSTNEELETTNEELQSLNEELETTNQELEDRTKELDQVNDVYSQTLERIRLPVMLVNPEHHIEFWNAMALRLFGFKSRPPVDLTLHQLPVSEDLRNLMVRRVRSVLAKQQPLVARQQFLGGKLGLTADIHFSLIPKEDDTRNVLIMFEPSPNKKAEKRKPARKGGKRR
ncbi:MAG TPA: CheR family methyltransferase [Terriglobales bacterium]|jgi:two-component system CheB/CheR fusion protein